ncbi:SIR2 family protein [Phaeobacter inhibens]|uniref:SIR2 family protein n=1 Tax=Phaeobacter inhibens TaxID=221822 RepID=UPI000C9A4EA6|nr:SIR2 family protein [Phaeobacter inhibens]AUQ63271.1 hypothetical protein PhaeoP51_02303 [Phaeobacter inhibens]AUQ83177.1 hypothetical protein PhaeoP57_02264 [Phaeobacter inhibens]AUQ90936.1 hypothetical protein PhaeoP24_02336 [Phaeobacter inhibens]MDO6757226.1 SIR2 family protein [Phaeobacter inhibens]
MDDENYKSEVVERIASVRKNFSLQPIVFVGSGLSRRWISTPTWKELLDWAIKDCGDVDKPLNFFMQKNDGDLSKVSSELVDSYHSWAWGDGKGNFPEALFESEVPKDIYLKYHVCKHIKSFGTSVAEKFSGEAEAFSSIRPQSVITTNYDEMIEAVLPDYQPILGRGLITAPFANIGEVYKIHGTVDKASSIVLTNEDYGDFYLRRKYLTAKLLTFFAEHPILFVGYGIEDENIQGILHDLDEAMGMPGDLISNVFVLSRPKSDTPPAEEVVQVSASKGVRVQAIEANDFEWVFEAFGHNAPLANVNPQVLRAILARSYHLVRRDIPKQKVEVDFSLISEKTSSDEEFAKLFGIADLQPATEFSAMYPYNLTELGKKLGFPGWHKANALLEKVKKEKGVDIKSSDNRYHCTVRISKKSSAQMYSDDAYELLSAVRDGDEYELDLEGDPNH